MDHALNQSGPWLLAASRRSGTDPRRARRSLPYHGVIIAFLVLAGPLGCGQQAAPDSLSANSKLPLYDLKMDPKDLRAMERSSFSDNMQPATLAVEGEDYGYV